MELREKIVAAIEGHFGLSGSNDTAYRLANPRGLADAIIALPEIKEALKAKCSGCDKLDPPLLCVSCVREFIAEPSTVPQPK